MKKTLLLGAACIFAGSMFAQESVEPSVIRDLITMGISTDGQTLITQDVLGNAVTYKPATKAQQYYAGNYIGNGNCLADNGMLAGQTMEGFAVLMKNGIVTIPTALNNVNSSFNAITADGTRVVGWMANPVVSQLIDVPIYCDISADGSVSDPVILPHPEKDFLGNIPQFVTAQCISDDGKTICGQVVDSDGMYTYPIVFIQEGDEWTYFLPSESLFNNSDEMPEWPEFDTPLPEPTDFMTPEEIAELQQAVNDGNSYWDVVFDFMTEEEIEEYLEAKSEYDAKVEEYYELVDKYWEDMGKIYNGSNFQLGSITMNPEGTLIATPRLITDPDEGMTDVAIGYELCIIDPVARTLSQKPSTTAGLAIPLQVLNNGTIVSVDPTTYANYLWLPDNEDYITLETYLESTNPGYLPWLEENLTRTTAIYNPDTQKYEQVNYIMGGMVFFSEDMSVMAGGMPIETDAYSYVYGVGSAAVEGLEAIEAEIYIVYNLQGLKVLETSNKSQLKSLKGLYIVNGLKTFLK